MDYYRIYLLTFSDGSVYIGRTKRHGNIRFSAHRRDAFNESRPTYNRDMYVRWRNVGEPCEEILEGGLTLEIARKREYDYTMAYIIMGYDVLNDDIADTPSERHKKKISESKLGEKHHYYGKHLSEEHRNKLSEALSGEKNHFYGKEHSEESKKKMSETKQGMFKGAKNPSARPKEWWETHPTTRSRFKKTCRAMGWNFEDFIETFDSYMYKKSGKREKIYTYTEKEKSC